MTSEELQHRIKSAIILLSEGHPFKVGDLTFFCGDMRHFSVSGWTNNNLLENVTQQSALAELKDIKSLFTKMVDDSKELSQFIKGRQIEYFLSYDYGMGSIGICSEKEGEVRWETEL